RRQQPLEAWTVDARTRATKIVIYDCHIRPAQSAGTSGAARLTQSALMVVGKLVDGGLPDVDEGATRQMVRRDLHRPPPSLRRRRASPSGAARSPVAIASSARLLPSAPVGPWARRGRIGGGSAADASCLSTPSRRE